MFVYSNKYYYFLKKKKYWSSIANQGWEHMWVPVSSTGKISYGWIRDMGFNHRLTTP